MSNQVYFANISLQSRKDQQRFNCESSFQSFATLYACKSAMPVYRALSRLFLLPSRDNIRQIERGNRRGREENRIRLHVDVLIFDEKINIAPFVPIEKDNKFYRLFDDIVTG